jgi:hypothetical protein
MKFRALLVGAALAAVATTAQADLTYEYQGFISLLPHPTAGRFVTSVADPSGGLFFGDNVSDGIFYIPDILGTIGEEATATNVTPVDLSYSFAGGSSWQDSSYADGTYFVSGRSNTNPPFTQSVKATMLNSPPAGPEDWEVVGFFPEGTAVGVAFSGLVAFSPSLIAMTDFDTGAITFFDVTGFNVTAVGSPIPGPNTRTVNLDYDPVGQKLYAYTVDPDNQMIGGVAVFNSNGTPGGTSYVGEYIPRKSTSFATSGTVPSFGYYYTQLAVHPSSQQLLLGFSQGTVDDVGAKFQLFDISGPGPDLIFETNGSDVIPGDGAGLTEGRFGTALQTMTTVFFNKNGEEYIGVATHNNRLFIYKAVDADLSPVVPSYTLGNNPTSLTAVSFGVSFNKNVPSFGAENVTTTGTLSGTVYVSGADNEYNVLVNTGLEGANGTLGIQLLPNFVDSFGIEYDGNNSESPLYTINASTGGGGEFDGDYNNDGSVNVADVTDFAQDIVDGLFD